MISLHYFESSKKSPVTSQKPAMAASLSNRLKNFKFSILNGALQAQINTVASGHYDRNLIQVNIGAVEEIAVYPNTFTSIAGSRLRRTDALVRSRGGVLSGYIMVAFSAFALFLLYSAPIAADPLQDAMAAANRGDYETARSLWTPLANQRNSAAMTNLGVLYSKGLGGPQDFAKAFKLTLSAALQDEDTAQTNLGVYYFKGQGVAQDFATAFMWTRTAALQNNVLAMFNLGTMYIEGKGVTLDYVEGYKWLERAANSGNGDARRTLDRLSVKMSNEQVAEGRLRASTWQR